MERDCKGNQDRLSLLPDAILVEILSLLPLKSAVKTDTLSKRWRHLWTQITSVVVDDRIIYNSKLRDDGDHGVFTCLDNYIRGRVSPLIDIDTFVIDFQDVVTLVWKSPLFVSWLRPICRRNPRHLTVSLPTGDWYHKLQRVRWPPCIFKTRSLVSIQLRSNSPYYKSDEIELPYLKKLSIYVAPSQCRWLAKLVESCPLLEDLSLEFMFITNRAVSLKCTCLNLKRLSINLAGLKDKRCKRCKVVINAPKLEYLDASAAQSTNTTLCIGHEPPSLHEARLEFLDYTPYYNDEEGCDVEYFKNIFLSNVRILTLNLGVAVKTFSTFLYLTRLTLNIDFRCNFVVVTLFVELCPVLEVLTFRFKVTTMLDDTNWSNTPSIHALERIKKIEVLVCHNDFELEKRFAEVIGYLLNNALVLEHFCFSVIAPSFSEMGDAKLVTRKFARSEEELCDFLYKCPRASMDCEILFKGNFHSMARNSSDICLRE